MSIETKNETGLKEGFRRVKRSLARRALREPAPEDSNKAESEDLVPSDTVTDLPEELRDFANISLTNLELAKKRREDFDEIARELLGIEAEDITIADWYELLCYRGIVSVRSMHGHMVLKGGLGLPDDDMNRLVHALDDFLKSEEESKDN